VCTCTHESVLGPYIVFAGATWTGKPNVRMSAEQRAFDGGTLLKWFGDGTVLHGINNWRVLSNAQK
jgi:hypothetical protein